MCIVMVIGVFHEAKIYCTVYCTVLIKESIDIVSSLEDYMGKLLKLPNDYFIVYRQGMRR